MVLAAGDISEFATQTLQADGWSVHQVDAVENPSMRGDGSYPERFYAVYSKLYVFGLQKYEKGTGLCRQMLKHVPALYSVEHIGPAICFFVQLFSSTPIQLLYKILMSCSTAPGSVQLCDTPSVSTQG